MPKNNKIDFEKDGRLYYSIKELAAHFDVNTSLLRYWETQFENIRPRKTAGGSRQYTQKDIEDIAIVYNLLKNKGLTIEGAKQFLNSKKDEETIKIQTIHKLEAIRNNLKDIINEL